MQDEVEDRAINLLIRTSELSLRTVMSAGRTYMAHRDRVKSRKTSEKAAKKASDHVVKNMPRRGKQKVSELVGQGQGVENIDVSQTDIRGFEVYARKYGIDYAVRKDISEDPPKYLVFFKAKDADAMTAAFNEYAAKALKKKERPSIRDLLQRMKEKAAERSKNRVREKVQEHGDR